MPEGHTLVLAARRLAPLAGESVRAESVDPRGGAVARALDGATLGDPSTRGKHLLWPLADGRTLHSHLRMHGSWRVFRTGERWSKPERQAWLVLRTETLVAVQFNGPVLELLRPGGLALHPVLARLGPDVLDPAFDPEHAARRALAASEDRAVAELLLDQRVACGMGNIAKSEALWACRTDPFALPGGSRARASRRDLRRGTCLADRRGAARWRRPAPDLRPARLPPMRHAQCETGTGRRRAHDLVVPRLPIGVARSRRAADRANPYRGCCRYKLCQRREHRGRVSEEESPITCLIADDHEVVREGLRLALSRTPHIRVVGEAADGEAAVALAERRRPDVVIMDVRMGGMDGFEAACKIRDGSSTAAVLFFTAHAERNLLTRGREAGARGYLLKEAPHATIIRAIDRVAAGGEFIDPGLATSMVASDREGLLTAREREILQLLADGLSNADVAQRLFISQETVKSHVRHILAKLEADTRTQAVAIALRESIIA